MYSIFLKLLIISNLNVNFLHASNPPNSRIIFSSSDSSSAKSLFSPIQDDICPSTSQKEKEFLARQSYLRNLQLDQPIHVIWAAEEKDKEKDKEKEKETNNS